MSNLLKKIFSPNWIVVDVFYGDKYTRTRGTKYQHEYAKNELATHTSQNIFKIEHSSIRNKYRVTIGSECYDYTADSAYQQALSKLAEYNKTLIK